MMGISQASSIAFGPNDDRVRVTGTVEPWAAVA
jgi:hypothetical protein